MFGRLKAVRLLAFVVCLQGLGSNTVAQAASPETVTNVVCVLLDELSEAQIKSQTSLSSLQRSGMLFSNAAVMPADVPTRAALLTGLNPARLGLTASGKAAEATQSPLSEPIAPNSDLQQQQHSLIKLLGQSGYSCLLWNIYRQKPSCLLSDGLFVLAQSSQLDKQNPLPQASVAMQQQLQKIGKDKQGFMLFVDIQLGSESAAAASAVLGELKKQLTGKSRQQATLVLVLGAKKFQPRDTQSRFLHSAYQNNISANLLVGWLLPAAAHPLQKRMALKANATETNLVSVLDVAPTILASCGVANPQLVDGYDLRPYLMGRTGIHRPQSQFMHYPHDGAQGFYSMLRQGEWKLIYRWDSARYELYNLSDDPQEGKNLSRLHLRRLSEMAKALEENCSYFNARPPLDKQNKTPESIELPAEAP